MTSQTAQQITTIHHSLLNTHITQYLNEENEAMKFGQFNKYSVINIFPKNYAENEIEGLVPDLCF